LALLRVSNYSCRLVLRGVPPGGGEGMIENEVENKVKKVDKQKNFNKVLRKKCPICGKLMEPRGVFMHFKQAHAEEAKNWDEWKSKFEDVWVEVKEEKEEEVSEGPIPTPKEEIEEWFISQLEQKLQLAINSKKVSLIVKTLRDAPDVVEIPSPFGEGTIKVPASQAGIYLALKAINEQIKAMKEEKKEEQMIKVPNPFGTGEITVPASQVSMILAIGGMTKRIEKEEKRKVRLPDGTEMPVEEALFHMQLKSEQEKSKFFEEQSKTLQSHLVQLTQSTSTNISSPTLEFLNNLRQDFDDKVDKIITFLQLQADRQFQLLFFS